MMIFAILATTAFCKIATPTTITYAPDYIWPSWDTPTADEYLENGWYYNRISSPTNRDGYRVVGKHYEQNGNSIIAVYHYIPIPIPPPQPEPEPVVREFYKYDISVACEEENFLDQFMHFIKANEKVEWFWNNATIVRENDRFFISGTNLVVQSGIITNERVKKIIDRAWELGNGVE